MKRVILFIISIILTFNICSISLEKYSDIEQYNTEVKYNVETTLYEYFCNQLEGQRRLEVINNPYIVSGSMLEKYSNLNSLLIINSYKSMGEKIIWYDVRIKIDSLEYIDDLIKVDVYNIVNLQYEGLKETSSFKEHHIIYINNDDKNPLIQRDIYNENLLSDEEIQDIDSDSEYYKYISKKINRDINEINELDIDSNVVEQKDYVVYPGKKNKKESAYRKYNRSMAAKWARENVSSTEDYKGEDCTNFVSKSLRAGGLPTDDIWHKDSNAWVSVLELRQWLLESGYAVEYSYANCEEGDVIQFYNSKYGTWSHSVVVTYVNLRYSSGYVYVSAHTNAANNVPLSRYYPTEKYPKMRCLKIIY